MHEVSMMMEAVRMAVETAQSNGCNKVTALRLRIGELSGVAPEALRFAFDVVARGTIADGARLEIESVPAMWWCGRCETACSRPQEKIECPRCHAFDGELRQGRELDLAEVEVA